MTAETPVAEPTPQTAEEARAAKAARRRYADDDTAPPTLRSSGVAHEFWPSKAQFTRWSLYLMDGMGADDLGWWYARCPVHDGNATGEDMSAMINFKHGVLRCMTNDDTKCHEGKSCISLHNALIASQQRLYGEDDGGAASEPE